MRDLYHFMVWSDWNDVKLSMGNPFRTSWNGVFVRPRFASAASAWPWAAPSSLAFLVSYSR